MNPKIGAVDAGGGFRGIYAAGANLVFYYDGALGDPAPVAKALGLAAIRRC